MMAPASYKMQRFCQKSGESKAVLPYYSKSGDCVFFYFDEAESYAERVDDYVTVYRSLEDDRFVGFQVKGIMAVLRFAREHLLYEIQDDLGQHDLRITSLLVWSGTAAATASYSQPKRTNVYRNLMKRSGDRSVEIMAHA